MLVKLIKTIGHLYCVVLLYLVSLGTEILDSLARKMVSFISALIGIEETPKKVFLRKCNFFIFYFVFRFVSQWAEQNLCMKKKTSWMKRRCWISLIFLSIQKNWLRNVRLVNYAIGYFFLFYTYFTSLFVYLPFSWSM